MDIEVYPSVQMLFFSCQSNLQSMAAILFVVHCSSNYKIEALICCTVPSPSQHTQQSKLQWSHHTQILQLPTEKHTCKQCMLMSKISYHMWKCYSPAICTPSASDILLLLLFVIYMFLPTGQYANNQTNCKLRMKQIKTRKWWQHCMSFSNNFWHNYILN